MERNCPWFIVHDKIWISRRLNNATQYYVHEKTQHRETKRHKSNNIVATIESTFLVFFTLAKWSRSVCSQFFGFASKTKSKYLYVLLITSIFIWKWIYDNGYYITRKNVMALCMQDTGNSFRFSPFFARWPSSGEYWEHTQMLHIIRNHFKLPKILEIVVLVEQV